MSQWHCTASGTKYGPIELNVLRQWIVEGRVGPGDLVWTEGMPQWLPASSVPDLADIASAAGLSPMSGPGPGGALPYGPTVLPNAPGAVAGMVCGIVGTALCCLCVVSVVLGIVAITQSKKARQAIAFNPGRLGGAGMATAGLVLGIISLILGILDTIYWIILLAAKGSMMSSRGGPFGGF